METFAIIKLMIVGTLCICAVILFWFFVKNIEF